MNTSLTVNIVEVTQGFSDTSVQLLIENVASNVINLFDTTANVSETKYSNFANSANHIGCGWGKLDRSLCHKKILFLVLKKIHNERVLNDNL